MIELFDIKKEFTQGDTNIPILKGIHLFVPRGDFVSIMGPSGSGKSTLASILGFLSRPTSGAFKIDGNDVAALSSAKLALLRNRMIGYIFQDFNLLDGLSAVENVALPLVYAGIPSTIRTKKALQCLEKVGLAQKAQNRPNQLSGGQKQRVAIARALVNDPKILFADEPCGALDKKTGMEILAIMQTLNAAGHTIVMVTHSPQDALYTKRIVHLVDGLIVRDELVEKPAIAVSDAVAGGHVPRERIVWNLAEDIKSSDPAILEKLLTVLEGAKSQSTRIGAATSISRWIDDDRAVVALDQLLDDPEWSIRAEVVRSLSRKSTQRVFSLLMKAFKDVNPWVRFLAVSELRFVDNAWLFENHRDLVTKFAADPDERIRATVARIIETWNEPCIDDLLFDLARDPDGRVRANAIEAMCRRSIPASKLDAIKVNLDDPNNRARANAAVLVFSLSPDLALNCLEKMLLDSNNMMRISAGWALGQFDDDRATKILLAAAIREKDDNARTMITKSLAKTTDRITSKPGDRVESVNFVEEIDALLKHEP